MKKMLLLFYIIFLWINKLNAQQNTEIIPQLDKANLSDWTFDGNGGWYIINGELILSKAGVPSGPIRRPAALAVFNQKEFENVTVEVDIKSTAPLETIRRDLDIILDYQSPGKFYYIHLAGITDSNHNGIFIVNNADRKRIDSADSIPQLKDTLWHHVKVVRNNEVGSIEVYVDNSDVPALKVKDKTINSGKIGLGSFDDTGIFKNIKIKGRF